MSKYYFLIISTLFCFSISAQEFLTPETQAINLSDTFHQKYIIQDHYRWLENTQDPATKTWVKEQNKLSKKYLASSARKTNALKHIEKYGYWNNNNPKKIGNRYFEIYYTSRVSAPILVVKNSLRGTPTTLVDPNYISKKDNITIADYHVSKDGKLLAYQFKRNGSDWTEIKVVNINTGKHKKDHIKNVKHSNIAWKDNGFFYIAYQKTDQFAKTQSPTVYYHQLGTPQSEDKIIFQRKKSPNFISAFFTTPDERFFILKEKNSKTNTYNFFYIDYTTDIHQLRPLILNLNKSLSIIGNKEEKLLAVTNQDDSNIIVEIDPDAPNDWNVLIPPFANTLLLEAYLFKDRILVEYLSNRQPIVIIYDYSGDYLSTLEFPIASSIDGFSGSMDDDEILYNFQSYAYPPVVYKLNLKTFEKKLTEKTTVSFNYQDILYKGIEYPSKDGTMIPMILVYKKGLELDGQNPTILKTYGGFGIISSPRFDIGVVSFIMKGGIFAYANIRGGGDKGIDWARAGKGVNKQNSFDDFIAGAEYLIKNKYTNNNKLAITGGSNGGLVVAAAAIQRPQLFKVAIPQVAPLDMLRFEKFTVGQFHTKEYGTVSTEEGFKNLLDYSPYHNILEKVNYPTMLIITSENDDRVPPFHSYKFVARLQNRIAQTNPIILKTIKKAGHNGSTLFGEYFRGTADFYGFIMNELEMELD